MDQVVLDSGKRSYFAFVEEAMLVHGRDFSVFLIGNVCLRGQLLINLICTLSDLICVILVRAISMFHFQDNCFQSGFISTPEPVAQSTDT